MEENLPISVAIHDLWERGMGVGARADDEQEHEQQRLEIKDCSLDDF